MWTLKPKLSCHDNGSMRTRLKIEKNSIAHVYPFIVGRSIYMHCKDTLQLLEKIEEAVVSCISNNLLRHRRKECEKEIYNDNSSSPASQPSRSQCHACHSIAIKR